MPIPNCIASYQYLERRFADSHPPISWGQLGIAGPVDLPHAAGPKGRKDLVRAEAGPSRDRHLFSAAVQLTMSVIGAVASPVTALTRNR